jgi:hypothetical protein
VEDSTTQSHSTNKFGDASSHKTRTISELVENPTDGFFAGREKVVADEKVMVDHSAGDKDERHAGRHDPALALRAKRRATQTCSGLLFKEPSRKIAELQIPDMFIMPCIPINKISSLSMLV